MSWTSWSLWFIWIQTTPNYAYDTVTLRLNRTLWHRLDTPLAVEIK